MLDSDICIYLMKNRHAKISQKFASFQTGEICISVVTHGELYFGASKSQHVGKNMSAIHELLLTLPALKLDENAALHYGDIRAILELKGQTIGSNDLWIAAHARSQGITLVSNNLREFSRVPDLLLENWTN